GAAFVAVLCAFGAVPGVELGIGGGLVVLVAEPALQRPVGRLVVGVFAVIAAFAPRHVGVVGVDDRAAARFDVVVVGAVDRPCGPDGAFEARGFKAVFD